MPRPKAEINITKVENLAATGLSQQQIAESLGISESTLYKNKRENKVFAEAIKRGKARGIALVTSQLVKQIQEGNTTAMIFFLKTQAGWRETIKQEITGAEGGAIRVEAKTDYDLSRLNIDQLKQLEELLGETQPPDNRGD